MAKSKSGETKKSGAKKSFEQRLERLEELGDEIRRNDIPLDDAIKAFEEGINLARDLEKDLEKIESRIEILMNGSSSDDSSDDITDDITDDNSEDSGPELGLFDDEE